MRIVIRLNGRCVNSWTEGGCQKIMEYQQINSVGSFTSPGAQVKDE